MSNNNFYNILKSFNKVAQEPAQPVQQQAKAKTKLQESMDVVSEKYMGFKKVEKAAKAGGAKDPAAVAASIGRKKYGKEKFQKAAAAGKKMGESAQPTMPSKKAEPVKKKPMTPFKAKEQSVAEVAPPGAKAERMVKGIKKSYAKGGKLTPKEKSIAYATAWKAHNRGKLEETIKAMFDAGFTKEQIAEGWEDMLKDVEKRSKEEKGTGKFDKKKTDKGTKYTRKYDAKSGESDDNGKDGEGKDKEKRGRGRPKKNTNESFSAANKMIAEAFTEFFEGGSIQGGVWTAKPGNVPVPTDPEGAPSAKAAPATKVAPAANMGTAAKALMAPNKVDPKAKVIPSDPEGVKEEEEVQESLNQMRRIAGLPVIEAKDKKADKDYDGDGKVESGKDEYLGSKIAAAKKAGKLKEGEMCSKCDCDPCKCDDEDKEKVDECMASPIGGMAAEMEQQQGRMNINTNMSSDGNKSVTITADGDAALELMQMLKLAGMGGSGAAEPQAIEVDTASPGEVGTGNPGEPEGIALVVDADEEDDAGDDDEEVTDEGNAFSGAVAKAKSDNIPDAGQKFNVGDKEYPVKETDDEEEEEDVEEAKDPRYQANTTPKEKVEPVQAQIRGGNGDVAGQEKKMTPHGYQFGDNPQAMRESLNKLMREYESIKVRK